jgi:hypothetical protein
MLDVESGLENERRSCARVGWEVTCRSVAGPDSTQQFIIGGDSRIRTLTPPLDPVSCRCRIARVAEDVGVALAPCTGLHRHATPRWSRGCLQGRSWCFERPPAPKVTGRQGKVAWRRRNDRRLLAGDVSQRAHEDDLHSRAASEDRPVVRLLPVGVRSWSRIAGRRVAALQPFDASVAGRPLPSREAAIRKRSKVAVADPCTLLHAQMSCGERSPERHGRSLRWRGLDMF